MSVSALQVIPFKSLIGAEVRGIGADAGQAAYAFIRDALDRYAVVVLRGQELSPSGLAELAGGIGEIHPLFYNRYAVPDHPEITVVSNITQDGEAIGIADAGMLWHTDGSFNARPDMYTLLYGIDIPHRNGSPLGDTVFASVDHAWEALPDEMKSSLEGHRAIHSFIHHIEKKEKMGQLKRAPLTSEQKAKLPEVEHPVVRRHPNTGRACLFVSEGHTKAIQGMPQSESDALLAQLWAHIKEPRFQYRHRWRKGDLVIWDNCAVQHLAVFDYADRPRRLHRAATLGTPTVAWHPT